MAILADYHLHTSHSTDSQEPMENMILRAINLGLNQICFTEHMDMDYPREEGDPEGQFLLNTDSYLFDLIRLKEKYADQITVLFGVELGLQPHLSKENARYIKEYDFDFVIASSHVCNKKDPYLPSFYAGREEEEAYREYFSSILDNLKCFSNFDVYGHLDYVVRYGPDKDKNYTYEKYKDLLDRILETLLEKEKGLEINTGGLNRGLSDFHPCTGILKRYRQLGGEVLTVGSDAHDTARIADEFKRVSEVLTECGFKYYTVFEKRMPEFRRL